MAAMPSSIPDPVADSSPAVGEGGGEGEGRQEPLPTRISGLPMLSGWRLSLSVLSLCMGVFLSSLETTIIATALVTISSDLGHFDKSSWIVVAYLLTYTGLMIIFTRMSDIFGRKQALLVAVGFFTVWSLACGFAQTIEELIVFRALQGIGGSGIYSLAMASMLEITPLKYIGHTSAGVAIANACASILGPIVGGAITSATTWRWVFWLNIPGGSVIIALIAFVFPRNINQQKISRDLFAQIDWPGVVLSLTASVVLCFALESGGNQYAWNSAAIVSSLVISGVSWVAFTIWQAFLTARAGKTAMLPIFPTRLVGHRVIASALASAFFTGFPFLITIFNLPQRFQIVSDLSPVQAGIRMLPLLLLTAVASGVTGAICSKKNYAFELLLASNALQILSTALFSTLPTDGSIPATQYVLQAVLGYAFGTGLVSLMVITRVEVSADDNAVAMGAITQVRVLGGIIGLAIVQAVLLASLRSSLAPYLSPAQLEAVLSSASSISSLQPAAVARRTREAYGEASNVQMRIVSGFAGASLLVGLGTYRRERVKVKDVAEGRGPADLRKLAALEAEEGRRGEDEVVRGIGREEIVMRSLDRQNRARVSEAAVTEISGRKVSRIEKCKSDNRFSK